MEITNNKLTNLVCRFYGEENNNGSCSDCPLELCCSWGASGPKHEELLKMCENIFKMIKDSKDDDEE